MHWEGISPLKNVTKNSSCHKSHISLLYVQYMRCCQNRQLLNGAYDFVLSWFPLNRHPGSSGSSRSCRPASASSSSPPCSSSARPSWGGRRESGAASTAPTTATMSPSPRTTRPSPPKHRHQKHHRQTSSSIRIAKYPCSNWMWYVRDTEEVLMLPHFIHWKTDIQENRGITIASKLLILFLTPCPIWSILSVYKTVPYIKVKTSPPKFFSRSYHLFLWIRALGGKSPTYSWSLQIEVDPAPALGPNRKARPHPKTSSLPVCCDKEIGIFVKSECIRTFNMICPKVQKWQ